jgi:hypothetical protein
MKKIERLREALLGAPNPEYFRQRAFAGWRPVAIVWEREIETTDAAEELPRGVEPIPFGLQVAPDSLSLEENSSEKQVVLIALEGIVRDKRLSQIAKDLNDAGFRTRRAEPWTVADVFELLPRLIEVGSRVFPSEEWAERRQRLFAAVE